MFELRENDEPFVIRKVQDAMRLVGNSDFLRFIDQCSDQRQNRRGRSPAFGVWFRGQSDRGFSLEPSVMRDRQSGDETAMLYHFQLRAGYREQCRNTFDWLSLMRHYGLPTRLLDWSENLLVALYFAAQSTEPNFNGAEQPSGRLYILNARRLNRLTKVLRSGHYAVSAPTSVEAAIRAEMSRARTVDDLLDLFSSFNRDYVEDLRFLQTVENSIQEPNCLQKLCTPIAVLPARIDARMNVQQSVFTLHGGKIQGTVAQDFSGESRIPEPIGLLEVGNGNEPNTAHLMVTDVDGNSKTAILRELEFLGIHSGALFPELTEQARFVREYWFGSRAMPMTIQDRDSTSGQA